MRYIFILIICISSSSALKAVINCSNAVSLTTDQVESHKKSIYDNINSNSSASFDLSVVLYCHAKATKSDDLFIYASNYIGLDFYNKENYIEALNYLIPAKNKIAELGLKNLDYLQNENFLSLVYHATGSNLLAIEHGLNFYNTAIELRDLEESYNAANTLGLIYRDLQDYDNANKYLNVAKDGLKVVGDLHGHGYAILNLGLNEQNFQKLELAENYFKEVISLWEEIDFKQGLYWAYLSISSFHLQDSPEISLKYINLNKEVAQSLENSSAIDLVKLEADYHFLWGSKQEAKELYTKCIELFKERPDLLIYEGIVNNLNLIYQDEQDFNAIRELSVDYINRVENFREEENSNLIKLAEIRNAEIYEKSIIQKDLEIAKSTSRANRYFSLLLLASALGLGAIAYLLLNRNRTLNKSNLELDELNKEIELRNTEIITKNETISKQNREMEGFVDKKVLMLSHHKNLLDTISKRLSNLDQSDPNVKKIQESIRLGNADTIWKELDYFLDFRNRDFTQSLIQKHPNLTGKEIQLCSLLRLNLNSKAIANLLFLSPDSVKVSRSRLRKKLGMKDQSKSLFGYLSNFA